MNKFRFDAFLREFHCLHEILSDWAFIRAEDLNGIEVRRISRELLECAHGGHEWFACDDDGFVLMHLGSLHVRYSEHLLFPDDDRCEEVELSHDYTIGEALSYFPCPGKIAFLVRLWGTGSIYSEKIVVYKRPKGFTLLGWNLEQAQRHHAEVKREIAEFDAQS